LHAVRLLQSEPENVSDLHADLVVQVLPVLHRVPREVEEREIELRLVLLLHLQSKVVQEIEQLQPDLLLVLHILLPLFLLQNLKSVVIRQGEVLVTAVLDRVVIVFKNLIDNFVVLLFGREPSINENILYCDRVFLLFSCFDILKYIGPSQAL